MIERRGANTESLLIITGTIGAGKTTVLAEASDILALRHIEHAAIDLDALGLAHLRPASDNDGVMYGNLQSVCNNYASAGDC
jgi:Ni2+-binding GTPase involved in maturation of urease and hydrogenase